MGSSLARLQSASRQSSALLLKNKFFGTLQKNIQTRRSERHFYTLCFAVPIKINTDFGSLQLKEMHKKGADLCMQDPMGRTLLHYAVEVGSKEIVKYIIDNGKMITKQISVTSLKHR